MIPKAIHYTDHGAIRLNRGFTRSDVRWLLARGARAVWPTKGPTTYWTATGYVRGREGRVVFIEDARRYLVVSLEWVGDPKEEG